LFLVRFAVFFLPTPLQECLLAFLLVHQASVNVCLRDKRFWPWCRREI
jgi:hypothetical protein